MLHASHFRRLALAAIVGVIAAPSILTPLDAAKPLADRVVIRRDTFGVPHIVAETEAAAGFGYAQAEDHAAEMARRFLAARRMDNLGEARRAIGSLDRAFREVLEGFAEGYNLYVRQHRDTLPPWVIEISSIDALAQTRASAATSAASPAIVRALQQKYPDGTSTPSVPRLVAGLLDDETSLSDGDGSNALALSGRKTTSGAPILLGNPHLRWQQLYWEAHLKVPGRLDFYGSTLVGYPWLRAGFNDRLGYVQTNNDPDNEDIYALPLDPERPDHYRFEGTSRPLLRVDVAVEVKQDNGSLKTERRTYWRSHLGPIVHRNSTTAFAYRSTALDAWRFFEGFWRLSHARSLKNYLKTISMRLSPTSNFTYAGADGNILYLWNARIPKRQQDGTNYDLDVPGGTKKYVWKDLHPTRDLPQLLNPPGGYIQNANNPPWFVSLRQPLDPARFPAYFERGELALRPQLALDMLETRDKFSVEDVKRFWETYRAEVRQPFAEPWDAARPAQTPRGIANAEAALKHLAEAVKWTRSTYGAADVAWGEANRYRFGDLDLPGEGATGQLGAFRVQQYNAVPGQPGGVRVAGWAEPDRQLAGFGDAWVLLVHFTRPIQAFSVLAYGQTTDRASTHSRDQIRIFANRDLRPAWFADADIAAHLEREYRPR